MKKLLLAIVVGLSGCAAQVVPLNVAGIEKSGSRPGLATYPSTVCK